MFHVHRRLFHDDGKGVGEALDETGPDGRGLVATGIQWLVANTPSAAAGLYRPLAQRMAHRPVVAILKYKEDFNEKARIQVKGRMLRIFENRCS